ncbi:hypothetical protein K435DRAFT_787150 [Dendrothele bispora CBS 962.96]|uniref:DUF6533 domain-containing protein n=1 Tax=Dendrothele bispora (strain CBS 962.96) TaxID=1314807 RepID=A0A4S8KMW0_DENBC|nr:hypothetical protein K435DRAFT_787150 [Dendrothele bispora CBS 962.96]
MSEDPGISEDASATFDIALAEYLHLSGLVFLYYDHILTFPMEVKYLWKHLGCNSKSLFLLNRYYSVLGNAIVTYSIFSTSLAPKRCRSLHLFREILLLSTQVIVCLILSLRIWAIYGREKGLFAFLGVVGMILIGLASFAVFFGEHSTIRASITGEGCHSELEFITSIQAASAWEALFLYDSLLLALLLYKGFKTRRELGRVPLLEVVLRDGSLYYIMMTLANLANIFTFYFTGPFMRGGLSTLSSATSVTMTSRITFRLHANAHKETVESYELGTLRFAAAAGTADQHNANSRPSPV